MKKWKHAAKKWLIWDLSTVDILKETPDDDNDDDIYNESEANRDSEHTMSIADFTDFLYKAKQYAKHHGNTSLLGTVMDLDDKKNVLLTALK